MKNIERTCGNCQLCELTPLHGGGCNYKCRIGLSWCMPRNGVTCHAAITDEDIEAARNEVKKSSASTEEEPLTCASCFFASQSDMRPFPDGISSSITLPDGLRYCSKRDTRVPITLEGCELHSWQTKSSSSGNPDEASSLDRTIDECFRVMERLIAVGLFGKQKLFDDNVILQPKVAARELENSQLCMQPDMINQDLNAHRALNMNLKGKLSKIKKELSGKWRLLEIGEKPQKGDQAFLPDQNNVRCWFEPDGFRGTVKEGSVPVRRKITI